MESERVLHLPDLLGLLVQLLDVSALLNLSATCQYQRKEFRSLCERAKLSDAWAGMSKTEKDVIRKKQPRGLQAQSAFLLPWLLSRWRPELRPYVVCANLKDRTSARTDPGRNFQTYYYLFDFVGVTPKPQPKSAKPVIVAIPSVANKKSTKKWFRRKKSDKKNDATTSTQQISLDTLPLNNDETPKKVKLCIEGEGGFPDQHGFGKLTPSIALYFDPNSARPFRMKGELNWRGYGSSFLVLHPRFENSRYCFLVGHFWQSSYDSSAPPNGDITFKPLLEAGLFEREYVGPEKVDFVVRVPCCTSEDLKRNFSLL